MKQLRANKGKQMESMNYSIKTNEEWAIGADSFQFVLYRTILNKKKTAKQETRLEASYFPSLSSIAKFLTDAIHCGGIQTSTDMTDFIDKINNLVPAPISILSAPKLWGMRIVRVYSIDRLKVRQKPSHTG